MKEIQTDVVIVGSGGAGLRAAIEASDNGAKVLVVSKSMHRKAHTVMAEGGIAAPLGNVDKNDNWKVHANDTLEDGLFIGNMKMIEILCKDAKERILELENWGAIFDRTDDGLIHQRPFGAHSCARVCHIGDRTGLEIIQTLSDQVRKREIPYLEETVITNILKDGNKVAGIALIDMKSGDFIVVKAKAVILATGGYARIYKTTTNPWESTGDGYAIAYNNGIELWDMEMVQFHPTGMIFPESAKGLLVTEGVRGDGGILTNIDGERFMKKYDPKRMDLSARDIVTRAIFNEVKEGRGTKRGGVYLDISHKPKDYVINKLPKMVQQFKDFASIDITKEKMEVAPTAHYTMGGIKVDSETCMTTLNGLFASGETAVSVHGANRLGGNSLIDILVFGRLSGKAAAEYCKRCENVNIRENDVKKELDRISKPLHNSSGTKPQIIKRRIKDIMEKYVHISRNPKNLNIALKKLEEIKGQMNNISVSGTFKYNHEFNDFLDISNMIVCAEATTRAALEREESRGAHFREDFPKLDDDGWLVNIACVNSGRGMELKHYPVSNANKKW